MAEFVDDGKTQWRGSPDAGQPDVWLVPAARVTELEAEIRASEAENKQLRAEPTDEEVGRVARAIDDAAMAGVGETGVSLLELTARAALRAAREGNE
jgi:hypothetical protein